MGSQKLRNIRKYHFRNSRALDVARWDYHFEGGSAQDVLKALACYQNPDGGFAYGLEPDIRTEVSNPMATWTATRILRELELPELADKMIDKILDYLENALKPNNRWPATIPAHNKAPHAPWFTHTDGEEFWSWNPTIELAAFILARGGQKKPGLYAAAEGIIKEALTEIMKPDFVPQANELSNICEAGVILTEVRPDLLPGDFLPRMNGLIDGMIAKDLSLYNGTDYIVTPEFVLNSPKSPYYPGIKDIADSYCDHLENSSTAHGYWDVVWTWGEDPLPPDTEREWRGALIMEHMLYLQNFKPQELTIPLRPFEIN